MQTLFVQLHPFPSHPSEQAVGPATSQLGTLSDPQLSVRPGAASTPQFFPVLAQKVASASGTQTGAAHTFSGEHVAGRMQTPQSGIVLGFPQLSNRTDTEPHCLPSLLHRTTLVSGTQSTGASLQVLMLQISLFPQTPHTCTLRSSPQLSVAENCPHCFPLRPQKDALSSGTQLGGWNTSGWSESDPTSGTLASTLGVGFGAGGGMSPCTCCGFAPEQATITSVPRTVRGRRRASDSFIVYPSKR